MKFRKNKREAYPDKISTLVLSIKYDMLFQNLIEGSFILIDLVLDILNGTRVIGMRNGRQIRPELI